MPAAVQRASWEAAAAGPARPASAATSSSFPRCILAGPMGLDRGCEAATTHPACRMTVQRCMWDVSPLRHSPKVFRRVCEQISVLQISSSVCGESKNGSIATVFGGPRFWTVTRHRSAFLDRYTATFWRFLDRYAATFWGSRFWTVMQPGFHFALQPDEWHVPEHKDVGTGTFSPRIGKAHQPTA